MTGTDGRFSLGPAAEIGAGDLANLRPRTVGWPRRLTRSIVPGIVAFLVLFGGWELGVRVTHIPATELVAPSSIFRELWRAPGFFASNAWITIQEAFWGFLVAFAVAIAAAVLVVHSKVMDRALTPIVVMLQVTPILALAPPLVVWLGFGPQPKIVMAALITFVPLFTNATVGFRAIDPATFEVMRSVNASKPEIFTRLRVPHSLPYLLAATRVCVGLALIGAVVAEFFDSSAGLGWIMANAQQYQEASVVWAAIFTLIFIGVVLVALVTVVHRRLLRWAEVDPANP
ncbi:MAG: ABC transporter permease [Acidimicrobiales bacterium]